MNSVVYTGWIDHMRCEPILYRFRYPIYCYGIDIDELPQLAEKIPFFSYNKFNILSIHDSDYLPSFEGTIKERVAQVLSAKDLGEMVVRVELVTGARFLNYVFNPVNFYRCYGSDNEIVALIAEVNNTFGETHIYVLTEPDSENNSYLKYSSRKEFHVSPFNDISGDYLFYLLKSEKFLDVRVNINKEDRVVFTTKLSGTSKAMNCDSLVRTIAMYPLSAVLNSPRIMFHAFKLWWSKRLPVYTKPIASSEMTVKKACAGPIQRICTQLCYRFFSRIRQGCLVIEFPDGSEVSFGSLEQEPRAQIEVKNYDFFVRSIVAGDIGFGESYVDGQWDSEDLCKLFTLFW